jgi:hypothetical protein
MEDLQGEILLIAKLGGLVFAAFTHYVSVIKPIAIFNERQKHNFKSIEKMKIDMECIDRKLTKIITEHEKNEKDGAHCKTKTRSRR